jgi:RNA polymerase sigma-70 factor (ECF subfamily)
LGHQDDQLEPLRMGDSVACEQFVHRYARDLFGWLYRLTGCREEAEDLAQESFSAFWASIRRKKPPVESRIWLFSIARNLWRQHCRRKAASLPLESDPQALETASSPTRSALNGMEQEEMVRALEAAVADLDAEYREVFALRVWHDWDYADIAAVQGINPGLARWRFFRARQQIRERLGRWFEHDEAHDET